jgi:DMSO/TMAO reductase YedYZ molybdopterin-dependent catalytic subunit
MLSAREPLVNGFHAPIMTFPEKHPLLMHSDSPPLLESARRIFDQAITANEDFFVRWHHPVIPEAIDLNTYRLSIRGHVERPLDLSVAELRSRFESTQFYAVKQCGGNTEQWAALFGGVYV